MNKSFLFLLALAALTVFCTAQTPCGDGKYASGSTCLSCSSACATCTGPSPAQCITCKTGTYMNTISKQCQSTCASPGTVGSANGGLTCTPRTCGSGQWLSADTNQCVDRCDQPNTQSYSGGVNTCKSPCASGQFYYSGNFTCLNSCPAPLKDGGVNNGVKICNRPCDSSQVYDTELSTCVDYCNWPKKQANKDGYPACSKPCASGQFYNTNAGVCVSSCNSPQTQDTYSGIASCTCPSGNQFIASSNSCTKITCTAPLVPSNDPSSDTPCVSPCDDSDNFYVPEMKACSGMCHYPRTKSVKNGLNYCTQPCASGQ